MCTTPLGIIVFLNPHINVPVVLSINAVLFGAEYLIFLTQQ